MLNRLAVSPSVGREVTRFPRRHARALVLVAGALASLVATIAERGLVMPALAVVPLIALVPIVELFSLPGGTTRRRETATFTLIVAAAALGGWPAALAAGLLGLASEEWLAPADHEREQIDIYRPAVLTGLVLAGALASAIPSLAVLLLLLWIAAIGVWTSDRRRHGLPGGLGLAFIVLTWLLANLSMPYWLPSLPVTARELVAAGTPALRFALGFMTVDSLLATGLATASVGSGGLRFWRGRLLPTAGRYTLMTVAGAVLAILISELGAPGLMIAFTVLIGLLTVLGVRLELEHSHRRLVATVCALSSALDARDAYTRGHSDRVASFAVSIAAQLGWPLRARRELELAAHLHDVGKIGVPDDILCKPGRLTDAEFAVIQRHAELSAAIVRNVPEFQHVAELIWQHHERLDGSGYPRGLAGDEILPAARILAIADSFDAMTSSRPYRAAMPAAEAAGRLAAERGLQYDARMVDIFLRLIVEDRVEGVLAYTYCLSH